MIVSFTELQAHEKRILQFSDVNRAATLFHNANPRMEKVTPIDFRDKDVLSFFRALQEHEVKYLLVGGFAMAFHGYIRATHDLDLWIKDNPENIQAFKQALIERGVKGVESMRSNEWAAGFTEFFVGDPGFKVEPLKSLKTLRALDFDICYSRAADGTFQDISFKVIHAKDLLKEKQGINRPKDQGDIEFLKGIS